MNHTRRTCRIKRLQNLQALWHQVGGEARNAGEVAPGPRELLHDAGRDRVADQREDDRDRPALRPCAARVAASLLVKRRSTPSFTRAWAAGGIDFGIALA